MSIKIETLELIARTVKDRFSNSQFLEIFAREAVPQEFINYPDSKYNLVSKLLVGLEMSNVEVERNHKLLHNLIARFAHPLTLNGSQTESHKLVGMFNSWLQYDNLELQWNNNELKVIELPSTEDWDKLADIADSDYEKLKQDIGKTKLEDLREYVSGYNTLISVIQKFFDESNRPFEEINSYYARLVKLLKTLNEKLFSEVYSTFTFTFLYIPFDNLFSVYSPEINLFRVEQLKQNAIIIAKMNKCYGDMSGFLMEIELNKSPHSEGKDIIQEAQEYVSSNSAEEQVSKDKLIFYKSGSLTLNMSKAVMKYEGGGTMDASPGDNWVKLLCLLFHNDGRVVENIEVVKQLKLGVIEEGDKNTSFSEKVGFVRRDMVNALKKVGMPEDEIKKFVVSVRKVGYKLNIALSS